MYTCHDETRHKSGKHMSECYRRSDLVRVWEETGEVGWARTAFDLESCGGHKGVLSSIGLTVAVAQSSKSCLALCDPMTVACQPSLPCPSLPSGVFSNSCPSSR